jgi:TolB-like protein/Flp pilus assembly protein TadD
MNSTDNWHYLLGELRRRKVFRVATLYVITLWPLIQLADILQPTLGFSDAVLSSLLFLFLGGFPVALVLAWLYDLTREGVVRTTADGAAASEPRPLLSRSVEAMIIGSLTVVVLALFAVKLTLGEQDAVSAPVEVESRNAPGPAPVASAHSIAVLPFTSFSHAEEDQVFADGLTEELLNQLARQRELRVAARTSSFAYKGVNRNVQEVGRELGVAKILEGSVRRSDVSTTIRITAQLVDVESGAHLWSQTYDREYRDVLRIQDEIANAVAQHLSLTMLGADTPQASQGAASPAAFISVSRGRAALARRNSSAVVEAIGQFESAVRESPGWAEAHASLAEAYVLSVLYAGADREAFLARASQSVERALELESTNCSAWAAKGLVLMQAPDRRAEAVAALERAIELNPSHAMAYMWLGSLQSDPAQMLSLHRKALELDPRSAVAAFNVANNLLDAGDEAGAMQVFEQILVADPFYPGAYRITARINELHGRLDEAAMDYQRSWELDRDAGVAASIARLHLVLGEHDHARRWLERIGTASHPLQRLSVMWLHALLAYSSGDAKGADEWIERIANAAAGQGDLGRMISGFAWAMLGRHMEAVAAFDNSPAFGQQGGTTDKLGRTELYDFYTYAAISYRAAGRPSDADRILAELRGDIEQRLQGGGRVDPQVWHARARIYLLEGDERMALALLQRAVDEGWTDAWRLDFDPLWRALAQDERLRRIRTALEARLAQMRENLRAEMEDAA